MGTNYNFTNGYIGQVDGKGVETISILSYCKKRREGKLKKDVIYALTNGSEGGDLTLMLDGISIGKMTEDGMVTYNKEEKKEEKKKKTSKKEASVPASIPTSEEIDLMSMSAKIDEFLRASLERDFMKEIK